MKILSLVSDWKWTGPAEPMLVLLQALGRRGHAVELVCAEPPAEAGRSLASEARARGVVPRALLAAHRSAWRPGDGDVVARLAAGLASDALGGPFDVVHCWHSRDHVLAARALGRLPLDPIARRLPTPPPATRLVRSLAHTDPIPPWPWQRWLFGRACDGLLLPSGASAAAARAVRARGAIGVARGAVELAGEGGGPSGTLAAGEGDDASGSARAGAAARAWACGALGVPEGALLIGVVARMQRHRRFELLLAALRELVGRVPEARLVILGRGTHVDDVVVRPARALGLERHVVLAGYRTDDYAKLLSAIDLFTYLVPGSDGSCRALQEAAALGVPLVASRRGALPELVLDGETGFLVEETAPSLAAAWARLAADPALRRRLGETAHRDARARFAPDVFATAMERFYAALLRSAPISSR